MNVRYILSVVSLFLGSAYAGILHQNLIIVYDYGSETIKKSLSDVPSKRDVSEEDHPSGVGAATGMLLTALYQEAAPILVPMPLWHNIVAHKKLFDSFVGSDTATLYKRYGMYQRFKNRKSIAQFKELCVYMHRLYQSLNSYVQTVASDFSRSSELEKSVWEDPLFDKKNAPLALCDMQSALWQELQMYLMCSAVPIDRYVAKKIVSTDDRDAILYLFIPKKMLTQCDGLSFEDLPDVPALLANDLPVKHDSLRDNHSYDTALVPALRRLIKSKNKHDSEWVFYMLGHGSFSDDAHLKIKMEENELERWQQEQVRYEKEEKKWQQTRADLNEQLMHHTIRKRKDSYYGAANFRFEQTLRRNKEISEQNSALCKEQAAISAKNVEITKANIESLHNANTIAGISVRQFTTLLHLFNAHCKTKLFFYASCSAGGKHFIDAYHDPVTYKPLELTYTVMSDALTEAPSSSVCPTMDVRYYSDVRTRHYYHVLTHKLVNWKAKSIICDSCYNFDNFFTAAHAPATEASISLLLQSVTPVCLPGRTTQDSTESTVIRWVRKGYEKVTLWCKKIKYALSGTSSRDRIEQTELKNLPSVRVKKCGHFRVINVNDSFFSLTTRFLKNNKNTSVSVPDTIDALFLYTPSVTPSLLITSEAGFFPAFISMTPGNASHVLSEIDASKIKFTEIIQGFFAIPKLFTTKIITLKKVSCINDMCIKESVVDSPCTFTDVYVFNRFSLSPVSDEKVNGVMFTVGKKSYIITWNAESLPPIDMAYRCVAAQTSHMKKLRDECVQLKPLFSPDSSAELITISEIARSYA
jgi:hypothetical protein